MIQVTHGATGTGGASVGSATPQPVAVTAVVGVAVAASREDHVHSIGLTVKPTGTAGAGFVEVLNQSSAPSTPTTAGRIYFDNTNRLSWKGTNGFVRTFDGIANTADRVYTLPNATGVVVLDTFAQTLTNKTLTQPIVADFTNATHAHDSSAHGGVLTQAALGTTATPQFLRVGIGVAADATIPLLITTTKSPNSGGFTSVSVVQTLIQAATADFNNFAFNMTFVDAAATTIVNNFTQCAVDAEMQISASHLGTFGTVIGVLSNTTLQASAAGVITNLYGVRSALTAATNTTAVGTYVGYYMPSPTLGGATATNVYGVKIEDLTVGGTLNYAIYTGRGDIHLMSNSADKFGLWGVTPIARPTTAFAAAAFVAGAGTAVNDASTFGGYTLKQVVQALQSLGLLT